MWGGGECLDEIQSRFGDAPDASVAFIQVDKGHGGILELRDHSMSALFAFSRRFEAVDAESPAGLCWKRRCQAEMKSREFFR